MTKPAAADDVGKSPREREAASLASAAWDEPLHPNLTPRCARCGARPPRHDDPDAAPPACAECGATPRSSEAGLLLIASGGWVKEALLGASYPLRGLLRLLRSPALWKPAAAPLATSVLLVVAAFVLAHWQAVPWLTGDDVLDSWVGWYWAPLRFAAGHLGSVIDLWPQGTVFLVTAWLLVGFPFGLVGKLAFLPFLELFTAKVEGELLGKEAEGDAQAEPEGDGAQASPGERRSIGVMIMEVVDGLALLGLQGLLYLALLPLAIVPYVGAFLWFVLPPVLLAGLDGADVNLLRRGYGLRERVRLWRAHRWRFLGYGLSFFLLLTLPFANVLAIPAAAAGGAILYLELPRK